MEIICENGFLDILHKKYSMESWRSALVFLLVVAGPAMAVAVELEVTQMFEKFSTLKFHWKFVQNLS